MTASAQNRISTSGYLYDTAGNMTADSANTYGWNAESEMKSAASVNYTYDGDGNRVEKASGKLYWYGPSGQVLYETDLTGSTSNSSFTEYVYFRAQRIARLDSSGNAFYYFEDHVGSSRVIAEVPSGTSSASLCYDADFYPYGGEINYTNTCPQNYKYMGKERDTESNFDDFGARYYASQFQRFVSADWSALPVPVPYADFTNPQTLNLYAIVRDNPETFADLDGHYGHRCHEESCAQDSTNATDQSEAQTQQQQNHAQAQQQDNSTVHKVVKKAKQVAAAHPKTVKAIIISIQVLTALSGIFDEGASEALLPEEEAAGEALEGEATAIENVTSPGSINNVKADLSPGEFGKNLEESGYARSTTPDGHVQYTSGGKTYTIYESSERTPSVQVKVGSNVVSKIRLNPE